MIKITQMLCPANKQKIKCPYTMTPEAITIHNTANDASAINEVTYMLRNNYYTSFHYAVDDTQAVQGIALDRNAWHAGDGNGKGNRKTIAIEICYSKSGGERFAKALENAAELTAYLLNTYGWGIEKVTKHQDYNGKHCPHRILDEYGWDNFIALVKSKMTPATVTPAPVETGKTIGQIAREVIAGKWGNGTVRKTRLTEAGYVYKEIQDAVNALATGKAIDESKIATNTKATVEPAPTPQPATPTKKSNEEIAKEVLAGKWGNGAERKQRLTEAGYVYNAIQTIVNGGVKPATPNYTIYSVRRGDTLSGIASRFGMNYRKIASDNGISNPNKIYVGQQLKIYR